MSDTSAQRPTQSASPGGDETTRYRRPDQINSTGRHSRPSDASRSVDDQATGARRWWPTLATLLVIGVGLSLLVPAGRRQWAISIIRQPTPFTALYFDHPTALPSTVTNGQRVNFMFSIANHEENPLNYPYTVVVSPSNGQSVPTTRTAFVAPGKSRSLAVTVEVACSASPCRVQVSLPDQRQSIDFRVAVEGLGDEQNG